MQVKPTISTVVGTLLSLVYFSPQLSYRFVATDYSECSQSCGCGRQFRSVKCYTFIGEEMDQEVPFRECQLNAANQTTPILSRDCNDFPCPEWRVGDFGQVRIIRNVCDIYKSKMNEKRCTLLVEQSKHKKWRVTSLSLSLSRCIVYSRVWFLWQPDKRCVLCCSSQWKPYNRG